MELNREGKVEIKTTVLEYRDVSCRSTVVCGWFVDDVFFSVLFIFPRHTGCV